MKTTELSAQIQLFLDYNEPIVLQVYAIIGDTLELVPLFLTRDEIAHLSLLYSDQLSKVLKKNQHHLEASNESIEEIFFHGQGLLKSNTPLANSELPSIKYLLIELKKEDQEVQMLKKITHKQLIEGRHQQFTISVPKIRQRNVLDLTPKVKAISINNHTYIA